MTHPVHGQLTFAFILDDSLVPPLLLILHFLASVPWEDMAVSGVVLFWLVVLFVCFVV